MKRDLKFYNINANYPIKTDCKKRINVMNERISLSMMNNMSG